MKQLSIRLPESLHRHAKVYAAQEGISANQSVSTSLAEKLSASASQDDLERGAARSHRARFDAALARVPDAPPDLGDSVVARSQGGE